MSGRFRIGSQVAWRLVDGQIFAVTQDGRIHNIDDATGLCIWERLDKGAVAAEQLVQTVVTAFEVEEAEARADLTEFLDSLLAAGIVESC